jgi:hypothetical protein
VAALALPALGGLSMLTAQSERVVHTFVSGGRTYNYYGYTFVGKAFMGLGGVLLGAGALPLIASVALASILLYKVWNLIQDGHARTSPEKAVGFLFIPFFNFYWMFVALYGLTVDLGRYPRRHGGPFDMMLPSPRLALVVCIFFICTFVPFLQMVTLLPALGAFIILMTSVKNAAVTIVGARHPAEPPPEEEPSPAGILQRRPSPEGL